ncbi:MAG: hypothetical protein HY047_01580 [Acidobacteria bacterium]|nr:hypothetical protein [Acidobacteriota bacterium]
MALITANASRRHTISTLQPHRRSSATFFLERREAPGRQRSGADSKVHDRARARVDRGRGHGQHVDIIRNQSTDLSIVIGEANAEMRGDTH